MRRQGGLLGRIGFSITSHYPLPAAEMKYMRRTAAYTSTDYKTNTQTVKELKKLRFWTNYWNTRETGYNM
jgi:hypothetical protein